MKRKRNYNKRPWAVLATIIVTTCLPHARLFAKSEDSLATLRQFIEVCNSYKQIPLHVNIEVRLTADFVTKPQEDTGLFNIDCFVIGNGAYITMGGDTQVMDDSLMLVVSRQSKRMVLSPGTGRIAEQMKRYTGGIAADASLQKFAAQYETFPPEVALDEAGTRSIQIKSRAFVLGTRLAKETIRLRFREDTKRPVELVQVHRKILLLDSADYEKLKAEPLYAGKLVHPTGGVFFLLKESTSTYTYKLFEFGTGVKLPLQVGSFIVKQATGHYAPAKGYESFQLSENL